MRPGLEPASSWILVGFVSTEPWQELLCLFVYCLFRAVPLAYVVSQARGQIRALADHLHHSHSNAGSLTHRARPGTEPASSWILVRFVSAESQQELPIFFFFFLMAVLGSQSNRAGSVEGSLAALHMHSLPRCQPPRGLSLSSLKVVISVGVHSSCYAFCGFGRVGHAVSIITVSL